MTNALVIRKPLLPSQPYASRAAQYVRMSTDKQRYSIQNQAAVIGAYAHAHSLQIVRTYADEGKSGLHIKNRAGLQQLIADISNGEADYSHVLVYDVSRWGRFQDTDESAHYEFLCKQSGIKVAYCAEQFDNDGTMLSSIVKNLKRVMAAEYSRELSAKVHAGQSRTAGLGFRPGGPITYALQRELVDANLQVKGLLKKGEHKCLKTDRVRVRIGPPDQVAVIRWIFEQCLQSKPATRIANELNQKGIPTPHGRPWSPAIIRAILHNETYIGNIVYNRQSQKLGGPRVDNPSDIWIRGERCVEPIIEPEVFRRVQRLTEHQRIDLPDGEMLSRLRRALHKIGRLSSEIIDKQIELPCVHTYIKRFGSLRNTYRLIGYTSGRDYTFIDAKQRWAEVTAGLISEVAAWFKNSGRHVLIESSSDALCIDQNIRVLFRVARAYPRGSYSTQWRIPRINDTLCDWIIAIRLADDSNTVIDYVVIPAKTIKKTPTTQTWLSEKSRVRLGYDQTETADALARYLSLRATP
ncbi:recombinase family protein [Bradyrhizobium sp. C-145]|uniref:recombinase family protein n=1 Tax=Bradyrhizobium sp. C-145 TaxID=574727 RepID=UPI00201B69AA|nr:recombinase family protein [Bradyrhizobium sp. C-145]UQR61091.1 recombinase family protein [Bradyrhizobium sp. C-145]